MAPPALAAAGLSELVLAGFGDGSMRLYDRRVRNAEGLPNHLCGVYSEHTSWLVHAHLSGYELTSGCVSGQIKFWDLRKPGGALPFNQQPAAFDLDAMLQGYPTRPGA